MLSYKFERLPMMCASLGTERTGFKTSYHKTQNFIWKTWREAMVTETWK